MTKAKSQGPKPSVTKKVLGSTSPQPEGHKITGTTIGLITVQELHTIRTALLLNQNMPSHTRDSLNVLKSALGKVNDALRYCGEDISDINVTDEPRPFTLVGVVRSHTESTSGVNIQNLPVEQQIAGLEPYTLAPPDEKEIERRRQGAVKALGELKKAHDAHAKKAREAWD